MKRLAHMSVTRPTTEGDPIVAVYSVVRESCTGAYTKDGELLFEHCRPD